MRLTAPRHLPDAIICHQRQCAVDVVRIPRGQKAIQMAFWLLSISRK